AMLRIVSICVSVLVSAAVVIAQPRPSVRSTRLYVFDCGTLDVADTGRFRLKREEVATDKLSVGCYLVAHPRGTLTWDTGRVPEADVAPGAGAVRHRIVLPAAQERFVTLSTSLTALLAAASDAPPDITYW